MQRDMNTGNEITFMYESRFFSINCAALLVREIFFQGQAVHKPSSFTKASNKKRKNNTHRGKEKVPWQEVWVYWPLKNIPLPS